IVQGRPRMYGFKRAVNPLSWLEAGTRPVFHIATGGGVNRFPIIWPRPGTTSGMRLDVAGAGSGSGFGPNLTIFNKDLFGHGIEVNVPLLYTYNRYELYQFNARAPLATGEKLDRL